MAATNSDGSEGLLKEYLMFIKDMKAQWSVEADHGDREMGDKDDKDSRSWKDMAFEDKSASEEQKMKAREVEKDKEQQQLALHLETIRGRVKILIRKLNERDGVVTKNRNNMTNAVATDFTETLEELEGNVEHLKAKVAQALTGSDVHVNIKKLKYLRERLTVFMNVSDASWNMSVSQDMKDRFENARLYIQSEVRLVRHKTAGFNTSFVNFA
ncbi:hypothetical protein DPMN_098278 [Dreissena polymorpha]|uniref:Uncharacterized protein n=1 Tax=Dreissena polymorpha TaxID=45954 RepID=A0A9D4LDE2_DREPO|nr:hypothetical protein DPMN_098278 [Dreissena polymorpha]